MFSGLFMSRSGCLSSTPWILYTRVRLGRKCDTRNLARIVFVYETIKSRQLGLWLGLNCTLGRKADTVVVAYKFHPYLEIILFSLPYDDDPKLSREKRRRGGSFICNATTNIILFIRKQSMNFMNRVYWSCLKQRA